MNILLTADPSAAGGAMGMGTMLIFWVVVMAALWFFMMRPQYLPILLLILPAFFPAPAARYSFGHTPRL